MASGKRGATTKRSAPRTRVKILRACWMSVCACRSVHLTSCCEGAGQWNADLLSLPVPHLEIASDQTWLGNTPAKKRIIDGFFQRCLHHFVDGILCQVPGTPPFPHPSLGAMTLRTRPFLMSLLCFNTHIAGRRSFCSLAWDVRWISRFRDVGGWMVDLMVDLMVI